MEKTEALKVVEANQANQLVWIQVRNQLWPDDLDSQKQETSQLLTEPSEIAFLLIDEDGLAHGFIEGKYYQTKTVRYGHIEGWYVSPAVRGKGFGGMLLERLETWFLHHSIACFHSDTIPEEYPSSTKAHLENGYETLYELHVFMKKPPIDNSAT